MSAVSDMFAYLKRPYLTLERETFSMDACRALAALLGFALLMLPILGIVMSLVFTVSSTEMPVPSDEFDALQNSHLFFVLAVIAAPITEELLFRSWLGSRFGILVVLPAILIATAFLSLIPVDSDNLFYVVGILTFVACLYLSRYWRTRHDIDLQMAATVKVFPLLFWGSCLVFGLIHLGNFTTLGIGPLAVLIILPQLLVGVMLAYIRMRFGILSAIGFHAAYNGILVSISLLAAQASGAG